MSEIEKKLIHLDGEIQAIVEILALTLRLDDKRKQELRRILPRDLGTDAWPSP